MTPDEWRLAYQQSSRYLVEPVEYLPCPGSVPCSKAATKGVEALEVEETNEDQCYRFL